MSVDACTQTECESEVPLVSSVIQTDQIDDIVGNCCGRRLNDDKDLTTLEKKAT